MLEYFVETKLSESLHGVAKECRRPALAQLTYSGFPKGHSEAIDYAAVFSRVDLDAAFDQVQGNHSRVCYATAEDAAKTAQGVELGRAIFATVALRICNAQPPSVTWAHT